MPAIELTEEAQINSKELLVFDFWADWCKPCAPLNATFDQLAESFPSLKFFKIEAEKFPDITDKYGVTAVPYFIFVKDGKVIDKVEGANGPELANKVSKYNQESGSSTAPKADLKTRLEQLVNYAPVMLFMKGTPAAAQCGFSSKLVEILKKEGAQFSSFNILSDEEVRQGLKEYSNWPTFPQLYINGKLIGGLDIVKEMVEDGEFQAQIPESAKASAAVPAVQPTAPVSNKRLEQLINQAPVMLFMKGLPSGPKCGFSTKIVNILNEQGITYDAFDILTDENVRQGLKDYSNWPTYPQLYVKGKLVGGLDIVKEMAEDGELKSVCEAK
jgi:Grx4 family monothiol glutaredoxin